MPSFHIPPPETCFECDAPVKRSVREGSRTGDRAMYDCTNLKCEVIYWYREMVSGGKQIWVAKREARAIGK